MVFLYQFLLYPASSRHIPPDITFRGFIPWRKGTVGLKISKQLNNNIVIAADGQGREVVLMGKGVAIEPNLGEVHAPCDGTISTFFDTGHAFGFVADSGVELLVHVGMDTIKLGGKGFEPQVKEGDRVKKGQLLLKFDMDYIKSQGLPVTTPVVVSNTDDYEAVEPLATGAVDLNTQIIRVKA